MDGVHIYISKASQKHNLWKEIQNQAGKQYKTLLKRLQISSVLTQYHKHLLVSTCIGYSADLKKKSNPDFQYPAVRFIGKKWWMTGHECLHSLLLWNWQIILHGLETSHGPALCAHMNLCGGKKSLNWNAMCKTFQAFEFWLSYHNDALLCCGHQNIPENPPTRHVIISSRSLA